jgi:pilus assembly protein CpaB
MRPIAVILIVVAMLAAGGTAFLAKRWLDVQSSRHSAPEAAAVQDVLVVARDVALGATVSADDLRYDSWPASVPADRFIVRKPGEDPMATYVGQVARRALVEGEPLSPTATFKQGNAGLLAGVLLPGMRAVSVAITPASAVAGFVVPGDRVDVVMAADFQRAASQQQEGKSGPFVRYAAETVLEDVKVLAIDQQMAKGKDGAAIQGKTATLEVTPKQAEVLTAAGLLGQLSLVLRGQGGDTASPQPIPPQPAYTGDTEASRAMKALLGGGKAKSHSGGGGVTINRAGEISNKAF